MRTGERLSILIFSRNDTGRALELVEKTYGIADQIVIVDSSDKKHLRQLFLGKQNGKLKKLFIKHTVALGYPDPLRMYALGLCKNRWVLLVDTDERLSERLIAKIKRLISRGGASAYAIRRYEDSEGLEKGPLWTWQIRLFDKRKVSFRGMIHEQASVDGRIAAVDDGAAYMTHMKHRDITMPPQYEKMRIFLDRMSYRMSNDRIAAYLGASLLPRKASESVRGRCLTALLKMKMGRQIRGKKLDEELTNFDYLLFYLFTEFAQSVKKRDLGWFFRVVPIRLAAVKRARAKSDAVELFEISKLLNEVGVIKFLKLDEPSTVMALTERYKNKAQGVPLLIDLLKHRYAEIKL